VLQTFTNGTKHYRAECGKCGKFIGHLKRPDPWAGNLEIEWRVAATPTETGNHDRRDQPERRL
jgi:hypothetical protein